MACRGGRSRVGGRALEDKTLRAATSLEGVLAHGPWLLGEDFSAADIQTSFVGELAGQFGKLATYARLHDWVQRFQSRPAYGRALEKGGSYRFVIAH